jgi:hypothetical protein
MLRTLTWIHAEAFEESLANDPDFMSTTTVRPDGSLGQLWGRRKDRTDLARARSHNKANDN